MKTERGSILPQTVVVLLIAGIMAVYSIQKVSERQFENRVTLFNSKAESVMYSLNIFYEEHCSNPTPPQPTLSALVGAGHLSSANTVNPFGGQYGVSIDWGQPSRLRVQTNIPGSLRLNTTGFASRRAGNTVFWERLPSIRTNSGSAEVLAFKHMHEPGACK